MTLDPQIFFQFKEKPNKNKKMLHFEDGELEWLLDKYAKEEIARRRYKNHYDNNFSLEN